MAPTYTHIVAPSPFAWITTSWTAKNFPRITWRMIWTDELDATGFLCPLPVLKARKRLLSMTEGGVLRMLADDPAAIIDVPHYCNEAGHNLIDTAQEGAVLIFYIRKSPSA